MQTIFFVCKQKVRRTPCGVRLGQTGSLSSLRAESKRGNHCARKQRTCTAKPDKPDQPAKPD